MYEKSKNERIRIQAAIKEANNKPTTPSDSAPSSTNEAKPNHIENVAEQIPPVSEVKTNLN